MTPSPTMLRELARKLWARAFGTGLSSSTEPASRLGPTDFDPSRIAEIHANEEIILAALTQAYDLNRLDYMHFSAAWDVTIARLGALSWHLPSDSDQSGEAGQTAEQAGPVGRERGPKASPTPSMAEMDNGWRPISEAPKDREILVTGHDWGRGPRRHYNFAVWDHDQSEWRAAGDPDQSLAYLTHWYDLPLVPQPPEAQP
ncbi:MAG TPA: hypothetical protein VE053_06895 [Allosphingosinicella sp.]|nr:hypothetical protein [Allosphingosinicella sp.]